MRKRYFCVLVLAAAAIIFGAKLAAENTGVPISMPGVTAPPGVVVVPITTGNLTGLGAISYQLQVSFDPSVVQPASPPFDTTGTISSNMSITPNPNFPGHLIIVAFQSANLVGAGTLLYLRFNVIGAQGQSTALAFETYTDPGSMTHPGFRFNEGTPASKTTNGSVSIPAATATFTPTNTATNTPTFTPTFTPTATSTSTFTPTATETFTPTPTATETFTPTATATNTFTPTATATETFTPTNTATNTATDTPTSTATDTPTPTNTATDTPTNTPTVAPTPSPFAISGQVTYGNAVGSPSPRFVSNVQMNAVGSPNVSTTTDFPGGNYSLGLFGPGPYTVTPTKTGGVNGISSLDAARIAAHVSGSSILSGNQLLAADVSDNGNVNSFDAALLARFVTGSGGSGTTGTWKFLPASRTYPTLTGNLTGEDFIAILMGEVSGNWQNAGARPVGSR